MAEGEGPRRLRGGCLCGAVRYEVEDAFEYAMNCHCSNCRRATGSAFKPFAGISSSALTIVEGGDAVLIYGDPQAEHDVHCATCGSLLHSVVREGRYVHVTMGTLADQPSIRPTANIFVGSKASWYEITDGLPAYDEFPTD
jgi:hypothetical protein